MPIPRSQMPELGWSPETARALFEQSPFSTVIYDAEGRVLALNAAFRELWGVGIETAPRDYRIFDDAQLAESGLLPLIARAFAGETVVTPVAPYDIARVSTSGRGQKRWVQGHFFPVRNASGELTNVVLTHVDLTDRVLAEDALRLSEQRLRLAQHAARIGTFDWHIPSGRVTWTEVEEEIFGLAPGTFDGMFRTWARLVHEADLEDLQEQMRQAMARGDRELDFNFRIRRPDGEVRWIDGSAAFLYDDEGAPERMIGVNIDVTDALADQQELEGARRTAEEASEAKSEFLAAMSHELRTPLNAIQAYAMILLDEIYGPVTAKQRQALDRIVFGSRHLTQVIDEILTFSRIEAGREQVRPEQVDARSIANEAAALAEPGATSKGLAFTLLLPDDPIGITTDPARARQVLINLLSNATKFTESGAVTLRLSSANSTARFEVEDTGVGIPEEYHERIFEPFWQVHQTKSRRIEGTGLGLTVSRRLAELLGGTLWVRSAPGKGSTFTFELPTRPSRGG